MISGDISLLGKSLISRVVQGPVDISFWWKIKNPSHAPLNLNGLFFLVNGTVQRSCNSTQWIDEYYSIPNGTSIIEWKLIKTDPNWEGLGWIDDACIVPISIINDSKYSVTEASQAINNSSYNRLLSEVVVDANLQEDYPELHKWRDVEFGVEDAYRSGINNIQINKGNYYINNTIYLYKPLRIRGETKGNVILNPMNHKKIIAMSIKSKNCLIENISFDGFPISIDILGFNTEISNNIFNNTENAILAFISNNIDISGNIFNISRGNDCCSMYLIYTNGGKIDNNTLAGQEGIYMQECENIIIEDNNLSEIEGGRIRLYGCKDVSVYHNNLKECSEECVFDDTGKNQWIHNYWGCSQCLSDLCTSISGTRKYCDLYDSKIYDPHPICRDAWQY